MWSLANSLCAQQYLSRFNEEVWDALHTNTLIVPAVLLCPAQQHFICLRVEVANTSFNPQALHIHANRYVNILSQHSLQAQPSQR